MLFISCFDIKKTNEDILGTGFYFLIEFLVRRPHVLFDEMLGWPTLAALDALERLILEMLPSQMSLKN